MNAAVKEKSEFSLFVKREIDNYGLDTCEFRIYTQVTRRAGNSQAWESLANMASACRIALSEVRKTLRPLNLTEITH